MLSWCNWQRFLVYPGPAMVDRRVKSGDPFLVKYQPADLKIASEFLCTWLPFLSRDLCHKCTQTLSSRIRSLDPVHSGNLEQVSSRALDPDSLGSYNSYGNRDDGYGNHDDKCDTNSLGSWKDDANGMYDSVREASIGEVSGASPLIRTSSPRLSWADIVQEDELEEEDDEEEHVSTKRVVDVNASTGKLTVSKVVDKPKPSREQREYIRFMNVKRKKDFFCSERVNGRVVNILDGLELHTCVFSAAEQKRIVEHVYELQERGEKGELKERTYSAPQKWMKGKGRVTLQFGCCYNYATDKNGNPPGILQSGTVDPIPHLFKVIIRRLVKWHVLPPTCVPDSCIVNIYEEGDCIPPHIDNHDFVRPFCTVSFLSECDIVFGSNLKIVAAGEFAGSIAIPLPVGSVLVLNGNGADVAKHCVPAVPTKRISITFRRMDDTKRPMGFLPEPDLQRIEPLSYESDKPKKSSPFKSENHRQPGRREDNRERRGFEERNNTHLEHQRRGTHSEPRRNDSHLEPRRSDSHSEPRGRRGPGRWSRVKVNPGS